MRISVLSLILASGILSQTACVKKENRVNIDLISPSSGQRLDDGTNFLFKAHVTGDNEVARTYKMYAIEDDGSAFTDTVFSHIVQTTQKDFYIEFNKLLPNYTGSKQCKFGVKMSVDGTNETSTVSYGFTIQ